MLAAGKRDRYVTIERFTTSEAASGAWVETWATWRTAWMGKSEITAVERLRAFQPIEDTTVIWEAPYISGLLPTDRLSYEGKLYDITGIAEIGRREGLEITAVAHRP